MKLKSKNAIIRLAKIVNDDGKLSVSIILDYGGVCQEFARSSLYLSKKYYHHKLESVAGHFIFRVMEIAGVTEWNDLKGKAIRVKADYSKVYAIGHIINNDWFYPEKN